MDHEIFLTAFLVYWLCYFVIPYKYLNRIRWEISFAANKLAQGVQVSLAPATLANLFRSLRGAYTADSPGVIDTFIPLHYLFGWFNLQFQELYSIVTSKSMKSKLPLLIHIALAFPICFRDFHACLLFRKSEIFNHCWIIFPNKRRFLSEQTKCQDNTFETLIKDKLITLEFLASICIGWLPFRSRNATFLETYNPRRYARHFGYD